MSAPLVQTKFQAPPLRPGLIERPQLLQRLVPHPGVRVTLVSAPAGAGKSTLLSQWCAATERPVAWLSLHARDNRLHRFLRYFIAALRQVAGNIAVEAGEGSPLLAPAAVESFLVQLLNELASAPAPFSLILDDYHVITDDQIHEALLFLIEHLPPAFHLVIATRSDPPWPLARLRARQELVEIRGEALRFTSTEAATFLDDVAGLALPARLLSQLEARTEGWIVGLQLAALAFPEGGDGRPQVLAERLAEPGRYIRTFVDEGPAVARLLPQTEGPAPYRQLLLAAVADDHRALPPYPAPVEPLSPRELGELCYCPGTSD